MPDEIVLLSLLWCLIRLTLVFLFLFLATFACAIHWLPLVLGFSELLLLLLLFLASFAATLANVSNVAFGIDARRCRGL